MNVLGRDENGDFLVAVNPAAMAMVFGLQTNDCREEARGIVEQLKGEALESDMAFLKKRLFA